MSFFWDTFYCFLLCRPNRPIQCIYLIFNELAFVIFPLMAQLFLMGQGLVIIEASTISHTHTTLGRTPLDLWSARGRDLNLTTHNIQNRQTSMLLVGFEPAVLASERKQTHALHSAATANGNICTHTHTLMTSTLRATYPPYVRPSIFRLILSGN